MTISHEFDRAFRLHQQGKLREAFLRYDAVLAADPDNAAALHYSGVVLFQAGKLPEAAERIRASIAIEPALAGGLVEPRDGASSRSAGARRRSTRCKEAAKLAPTSAEILGEPVGAPSWRSDARPTPKRRRGARSPPTPTHAPRVAQPGAVARAARPPAGSARRGVARDGALARDEPAYAGFKAQLEATAGMRRKARATLDAALARKPDSAPLHFQLAGAARARRRSRPARCRRTSKSCGSIRTTAPRCRSSLFLRQRVGDWHDLPGVARAVRRRRRRRARRCCRRSCCCRSPSSRARAAPLRRGVDGGARAAVPTSCAAAAVAGARLRIGYLSGDFHTHATAYPRGRPVRAARPLAASRSSRIRRGPTIAARCATRVVRGVRSLRRCRRLAARCALARGDPRRRHRHPRRPQGSHRGRAARRCWRCVPRRSRCITSAIPGTLGGNARRLPDRRRHRHAARARARLRGDARAAAAAATRSTIAQRPIADAVPRARARPAARAPSCCAASTRLQAQSGSVRRVDADPRRRARRRAVAAGAAGDDDPAIAQPAPRGCVRAASTRDGCMFAPTRPQRRVPRAVSRTPTCSSTRGRTTRTRRRATRCGRAVRCVTLPRRDVRRRASRRAC